MHGGGAQRDYAECRNGVAGLKQECPGTCSCCTPAHCTRYGFASDSKHSSSEVLQFQSKRQKGPCGILTRWRANVQSCMFSMVTDRELLVGEGEQLHVYVILIDMKGKCRHLVD